MQRKGDAQAERAPRGRDAFCPRFAQLPQVRLSPIADMGGEKGDGHAQRARAGELIVADDLTVDEHGADAAAVFLGQCGKGG